MSFLNILKKLLCPEAELLEECDKDRKELSAKIVECEKIEDGMEKDILRLNAQSIEFEKLIPLENPLEKRLNDKYPKVTISYKGRTIPNFGSYELDVWNFFVNPESSELQKVVGKWKSLPDDEKAVECQKWVEKYIRYTSDKTQYGLEEFWGFPSETLKTKRGDCDNGCILMGNLMLACDVPYWKVRMACGDVYDKNGKNLGGHAFLTYFVEKKNYWVAMDWCFNPDIRPVESRPDYKESILYGKGEVWFSFSKKYAYSVI